MNDIVNNLDTSHLVLILNPVLHSPSADLGPMNIVVLRRQWATCAYVKNILNNALLDLHDIPVPAPPATAPHQQRGYGPWLHRPRRAGASAGGASAARQAARAGGADPGRAGPGRNSDSSVHRMIN
jgi:hypothetical protein